MSTVKAITKDDVVDTIHKHILAEMDDVDADDLEFAESFRDFGISSLDLLEVVSASMRDLGIKVPKAELADIESVDQLADKFLEYL